MAEAKRARTAETPKPPSFYLRLRALYFYPDFGGGRAVHKVFAVVHLLFALAFVWAGRRSMSSKAVPIR